MVAGRAGRRIAVRPGDFDDSPDPGRFKDLADGTLADHHPGMIETLRSVMRFRPMETDLVERRLARAASVADLAVDGRRPGTPGHRLR